MKLVTAILTLFSLASCKGKHYNMPASSMEGTIETGSRFYVTKASEFNRNNIAVFDYYGNDYQSPPDETGQFLQHWEERVCRVIALSGDTISIYKGDVYINGKQVPYPEKAAIEYDLCSTQPIDGLPARGNEFLTSPKWVNDTVCYRVLLTQSELKAYSTKDHIVRIEKIIDEGTNYSNEIAGSCKDCNWTRDQYGPVYIPSPGETVIIDDQNFSLFKNIPEIQKGKFTIREKLYFVMGDNRHMVEDSRFIGFISHSNMHGIVK